MFAPLPELTKLTAVVGFGAMGVVAVVQSSLVLRRHYAVADRLRRCETALAELLATNRELQDTLKGQEEEVVRVSEIDGGLWAQGCVAPVPFVERSERRTRLLSVFNLKGGVGKTTITANLGRAMCELDSHTRVLVVDLDFQGTLSGATTAESERSKRDQLYTAARLLESHAPDDIELEQILTPSTENERLVVITANDLLEHADFREQARFLLDRGQDPRHRFRSLFHHRLMLKSFDVVLFDCPPRLTTSSVNALCASDFVLIPVQLTDSAWEAVPRTVQWLRRLGKASRAEPMGVVANQVRLNGERLIGPHQQVLGMLRSLMKAEGYDFGVLNQMVSDDRSLASRMLGEGSGPSSRLFHPLAREILRRMGP
ncbi:MAG: ParA family protein [Myxococcales bacterium]|nr:ParA family protein [Myxococcales bacterium]